MTERNFEESTRNGLRSQGQTPDSSDQSGDDSEHECGGMRVGGDYQAKVPEYNPSGKIDTKDAMLVWAPMHLLLDAKTAVDEYVSIAKEKHGYNTEQALGMLFWHKHNIDKALSDLANFTPFPDEWSVEDKVLFEQAFSFHGKNFHRIRQMLPDKSVSSLIKYYYSWKKTRSRTSVMDRHVKKLNNHTPSDASDEGSGESDGETKENKVNGDKKTGCTNCALVTSQLHETHRGSLCTACYHYWRTGLMRSATTKKPDSQNRLKHIVMKHKRKPPRGMHLTTEDLAAMARGPNGQSETILKSLDSELVSLKRQVQANKQFIGMQKHKARVGVEKFRPPEPPLRVVARWTNDELLLAVQGVRKYGKNFKAIAEVIGNKLEVHVRSFFVSYRRRYNLDEVLAEYELEHGMAHEKDEEMEVDPKPTPMDQTDCPPPIRDVPPPLTKQPDQPEIIGQPKVLPAHARLLPPKPMILQQPPPLIRPNTIPTIPLIAPVDAPLNHTGETTNA